MLNRDTELKALLSNYYGYPNFRFNQLKIINSILDGKDTLAIMPTGAGKSVCYQIPALCSEGTSIIISPLISLMQDQVANLKTLNIKACFLNSTQTYQERKDSLEEIENGTIKIVYVSPEGILSGQLLNFFLMQDVSLIAIDEAHCVSQWGHEFRNDYTRLGELKEEFPDTPFLALTATADKKTRSDIINQLGLVDTEIFLNSFDRPNIKYTIEERKNDIIQLDKFITANHEHDTGIVYCLSRKKVEKVANELCKLGHKAFPYHAGLSSTKRERIQKKFSREENIIVVATIAFGMGIDRPDVRFVAHLDLPKSIEGYYQETGRAGRDGLEANAWMVYGLQDVIKLSHMLESSDASESYKNVARTKLNAMLSLCETSSCRRKYLLHYFEEKYDVNCNNCDSCLTPSESWDATIDAQKVLSAIYHTGQNFGAGHIIDVLRGSQNSKVLQRGHDQLSVYGIGKDQSNQHWNFIIRHLLHAKFLIIKNWEYRNFGLTPKSLSLLKGEEKLLLKQTKKRKFKNSKAKSSQADLSHERVDLFEKLRKIRKDLAEENNVPPYIIFADKSLHDMCHILPRNKDEFLMVNGVGQSKCDRYANYFLNAINEH